MPLSDCSCSRSVFFYKGDRIVHQVGQRNFRFFRAGDMALAQINPNAVSLFRYDQANSVLGFDYKGFSHKYSPYGFCGEYSWVTRLAFNGLLRDLISKCYPLGNGHRFYNPILMRFIQPDTRSPFHEGGYNAYSYCQNDPVNRRDLNGKWWAWLTRAKNWVASQLPTYSFDARSQRQNGVQNQESTVIDLHVHRAGQTPSAQTAFLTMSLDDVEHYAGVANRFSWDVEDSSDYLFGRLDSGTAAFAAGYVVDRAVSSIPGVPGAVVIGTEIAVGLAVDAYLDRRLLASIPGIIRQLRRGEYSTPPTDWYEFS